MAVYIGRSLLVCVCVCMLHFSEVKRLIVEVN